MTVWILWCEVADSDNGWYAEVAEIFHDKAIAELVCDHLNAWSRRQFRMRVDSLGRKSMLDNAERYSSSPWAISEWIIR